MKLVNNLLFAANTANAFEAFALGAKAGLDPDTMVEMVNAGTGRSFASSDVMPSILSGKLRFGATIAVLDKDVGLGLDEARAYDVPMWGIEQAARLWRFAASQGRGGADLGRARPHRRGLGRRRNPQPQGRLRWRPARIWAGRRRGARSSIVLSAPLQQPGIGLDLHQHRRPRGVPGSRVREGSGERRFQPMRAYAGDPHASCQFSTNQGVGRRAGPTSCRR